MRQRPVVNPCVAQLVRIPVDGVAIEGMLELPGNAQGIVLFAHGRGSSRNSPHHNYVARVLHEKGISTLLLDLLTLAEDLDYQSRFDVALLTHRLLVATCWVKLQPLTRHLRMGYFGASTGAAAALQAAAALERDIQAVVSWGGRPDLAGAKELAKVTAPSLLLVGTEDDKGIKLNQEAYARLRCSKELSIVLGATHLFEKVGTLEEVARQAAVWFNLYLKK